MSEHTPGPWTLCDRHIIVTPETHHYCTMVADCAVGGAGGKEQAANARLVAAAPEMLAALRGLRHVIEAAGLHNLTRGVELGPTVWFVKASAALAAATDAIVKAEPERIAKATGAQ